MRRTIGWWLSAVGLLWATGAMAQIVNQPSADGIRIDGEVVQLDERCTVNMANRTSRVNADGSFAIPNVPFEAGSRSRVRAVCSRDGRLLLGSSPLLDLAVEPEQIPIFFDQYVPLAARIRVYANEDETIIREADEIRPMIAIAEMPNGQMVDITNTTAGTVWTSSDARIATVSPQGVVTPLKRGDVIIRAQNEGLSGSLRLQVRIPDDRDGDGLPDDFELANGLDPDDPTDALLDGDLDGLDNVQEFAAATSPGVADSDGDGLLDGDEVNRGSDPRDADSDGDGLLDGEEVRIGTDPNAFDTDGDGIGDGAEIDFDLDPLAPDETTTMAGQVIDPDGAAVEGAVVLVQDRFQGFTDVTGAFEIPGVVVDGGRLLARVRLLRDGVVLDGKSRRLEPVPGGITDAGTVRLRSAVGAVGGSILSPRGEPVPGARVVVTVGEDERGTNANAAGQYLFQRFDEGPVTVIATDPRTGLRGRAFGDLAEDDSVQIDVRLSASGTIQGSVFGRDGAPVGPAIAVRLRGPVNLDGTTDDFSRFRFDFIPLGVYSVEAFDENGNRGRTTATITGTNQVVPADVSFLGKGRVAGIVETGGGALVRGARVTLRSQSPFGGSAEVISDNAGGFDIPDIFVGPFELTAVDPATGLAGVAQGNVDFEGDVARVTVTLRGAGRIVGTVLESDAVTPVPGASVTVSPGGRTVVADDQGVFRFDGLPLGRYTLTGDHPDNPDRGQRVVNLIEPDAEVQADVTLLGLGTVRVTVLDAGGEPAPGARVTLDGRGEFTQRFEAIADADGQVEFTQVLAGPFALSAVEPLSGLAGAIESNVLADEQVELELRLESAGSITGFVLRPDGVTPVRGIRVRLTPSSRESTTDAVGRFRFDLVPVANGPFTLEAFDGTGARRGEEAGIALAEHAQVVERNIIIIGTGTVRGTILRADGTPASAAAVTLDSTVPGAPRRFANTEADGSYLIEGVPEGRFTVNASLREERQAGAAAGEILADGEVITLDIQMDENFIPPPPPGPGGGPPSNTNPRLTRVYDANNFDFAIHQDGSIRNGTRNVFRGDGGLNSGGFLLYMRPSTGPGEYEAFAGQGGRIELDGRQLSLPGAGPDGLQVTRRVYVPGDGYFVRFVEVLRNPTADPVEVDVQVRTHFQFTTRDEGGFRFTDPPQLNLSSSGDAFISVGPDAGDDADRWVVIDDRVDVDPFVSGNQPTAAAVFDGVGGAVGASEGQFLLDAGATYGQLAVTYGRVTIQPGQTVSLMHFGVQQLTGLGARAAAERLEQPAPEALVGLTEDDVASIANFDLAGAGFVDPLPALNASITGAVLEGDAETLVPRSRVTWKSQHPIFGRTFQFTGGDDGVYRINARLGGNGNNVPVPAAGFEVFGRHPVTGIDSPVFPGAFAEGTESAEQDIVFNNTGLVVGVVRRPDGNVVSTGSVRMTGGDLANAATANIAIDGRFVFTGVPPGNYSLVATVPIPGGTPLTGEGFVNVVAGEVAEAELEIIPTGGVAGRVLTGGGQPAIEVQTRILGNGTDRQGRSDTGGNYNFFDMPLGDFSVRAREPNTGIWSSENVTVEAFEVTPQDIQLIPLGEIQMAVTYSDGRPVADAAVQIQRDALGNFFAGAGRTDAIGRRGLRFVPLGGFRVRVISPQNGLIVVETAGEIVEHDQVVVLEVEVPVDEPPQVLLTAPADGAEFLEGSQVLLTAEANDDLGVRRVDFVVDGEVVGSDSSAPYLLNYRVPAGDGRAEIPVVAVAYDNGPNQTPSDPITIVRLDDEQPPNVDITAPFVGVRVIEGTRVGVSALANDDVAVQQVAFFAGDEPIGVDDSAPFTITWDVPANAAPIDEVAVTLRAVATDLAGNSAEATRDLSIVPDAEPTIRLVRAPEEGGTVVEGTTVRFEAVAQDDLGVSVDLIVGGEVLQTRNQPPFRFDWVAPAADAVENPFSVTLRARDTIGQTADAVSTFDVTIDLPPTVEIVTPEEGAEAVEGSTVQVTATAEDDLGVDEVRFYVDGELQATRLVPPYTVDVQMSPGDAGGAISIRVEAIDNAGQSGDALRDVSRLDDEVAPTGRITTPAPDAVVSVGASDVVLVIEREGSTGLTSNIDFEGDGDVETRLEAQVIVARTLLGFFDPDTTRVAVVRFAGNVEVIQPLTDDFAAVDAALDRVRDEGTISNGLRFDLGVSTARDELIGDNANRSATPVVYFLADGNDGYPDAQVQQVIGDGGVINAIRVGPDGNDFALRQMPEDTGGSFAIVDEAADLDELGASVLFGSDSLVVGVEADDDVAVRRVTVAIDSGDGLVDDQEVDSQAPFNAVFGLPSLEEQLELTITAGIEDFGGNVTDADPVTVTVLPAETAPIIDSVTTNRPDGASAVDFFGDLGIEVPATYGSPGDTVVITGRFFDPLEERNEVRFDGVLAGVPAANKVGLSILIPEGARSGELTIISGGEAAPVIAFRIDTDRDGLDDQEEVEAGTDPANPDTDDDGLLDGVEVKVIGTDPRRADTDGDGLPDGFEIDNGLEPVATDDGRLDPDGDGLKNFVEFALGTEANNPDTDGDGLLDGEEFDLYGSDPLVVDTDGAGATDGQEVRIDGTDPTDPADDVRRVAPRYDLRDGDNFLWDVYGEGRIGNGQGDAYDNGLYLQVGGNNFPSQNQMRLLDGDRALRIGPVQVAQLTVERDIYVPDDARFARYMEILRNDTDAPISTNVRIYGQFGSDGATNLIGESSGDGVFGPEDDWFSTDDNSDGGGDPSMAHILSGFRARIEPTNAQQFSSDDWEYDFDVTVEPGETVIIMHFATQNPNRAAALENAQAIVDLPAVALARMSPDEQAAVLNFFAYVDGDKDGLPDDVEAELGTDPANVDTDGDGLDDLFEVENGLNPLVGGEQDLDIDGDGLTNAEENALGTDPANPDTDGDGLLDGAEANDIGSDPALADTDGDGLDDGFEVNDSLTDPTLADTDGDGLDDFAELNELPTDPLVADTDEDGMLDGFELDFGFDPLDPTDGALDNDNDGLINAGESAAGSNPFDADSDNDQLLDGEEVDAGLDPTVTDTDGGGRSDYDELLWDLTDGLDPADDLPTTGFNVNLNDGGGFRWDIDGALRIINGAANVYDTAHRLFVQGSSYQFFDQAVLLQDGRELMTGPHLRDGVRDGILVWRRVFVPENGIFARHMEIIENRSAAERTVDVRNYYNLDNPLQVFTTSDGDQALGADDDWIINQNNTDQPAVMHIWSDDLSPAQPSAASFASDDLEWTIPVTIPPGGRAIVMHFSIQGANATDVQVAYDTIARFGGQALDGLTPDDQAAVVNLRAYPDTDGDGIDDRTEAELGTDPANPDTDGDGLTDGFEDDFGFDPLVPGEQDLDPDGDGMTNLEENVFGSSPLEADADGDGLDDPAERAAATNPFDRDTDGDLLDDLFEVDVSGTSPIAADTDDGGRNDFEELVVDNSDPLLVGDDAATRGFNYTLDDGAGFRWDITNIASISNGTSDAFDNGMRLFIDDVQFPNQPNGALTRGGREFVLGPARMNNNLVVYRRVYVPDVEGEGYARFTEIIINDSDTDRDVVVRNFTSLGSDGATTPVATSSGDTEFTIDDDWLVTDDAENAGDPVVLHLFADDEALVDPDFATRNNDAVDYRWTVTVPAHGIATAVHFSAQRTGRDEMVEWAESLLDIRQRVTDGLSEILRATVFNLDADLDRDNDGLDDGREALAGTDPDDPDTDDDGIPDGFEAENGLDPLNPGDAGLDPDGDGLTNLQEFAAGTPADVADIDRDNLNDAGEVQAGTDPYDPDSDDDELFDGDEVNLYGTNPLDPDTDQGGTPDAIEVYIDRSDPLLPGDDIEPPCAGEVYGNVCVTHLSAVCINGSATQYCADRGERLLTYAEFTEITQNGWVRPNGSYHTMAVAEYDACGGDVGNTRIPGFGNLTNWNCGDNHSYCNRSAICTAGGVGARETCSEPSIERATATFVNDYADRSLTVFFFDYICEEGAVAVVAPGEEITVDTFIDHQWRVRETDGGELLDTVTIDEEVERYVYSSIQFAGSFLISDGPNWSDPETVVYSCLDACALLFGGEAGQYQCSTVEGEINNRAFVDGYGDEQFCQGEGVAEDFRLPEEGGVYDCGENGCSYSAYVSDHGCDAVNYCWRGQ